MLENHKELLVYHYNTEKHGVCGSTLKELKMFVAVRLQLAILKHRTLQCAKQ